MNVLQLYAATSCVFILPGGTSGRSSRVNTTVSLNKRQLRFIFLSVPLSALDGTSIEAHITYGIIHIQ